MVYFPSPSKSKRVFGSFAYESLSALRPESMTPRSSGVSRAEVSAAPSLIMASSRWFALEVGEHVPDLLTRPQRPENGLDTVEIGTRSLPCICSGQRGIKASLKVF